MPCVNTILDAGESLFVDVVWRDKDDIPSAPSDVTYQVIDALTEIALTAPISVLAVSEDMSFVIPASDLPSSSARRRELHVVLKATYPGNEYAIETIRVSINRLPTGVV